MARRLPSLVRAPAGCPRCVRTWSECHDANQGRVSRAPRGALECPSGLRRMAGSVTRSHGCRSTPEVLARREIPARAVPWRFRFGDSGVKRNSLHLSGDRFRHNGPRYAGTWPSRDGQARRETDCGHVRNVRRDPCCGRPRCGFHVPRQAAIDNGTVLREPVFPHNIFAAGYACSSTP